MNKKIYVSWKNVYSYFHHLKRPIQRGSEYQFPFFSISLFCWYSMKYFQSTANIRPWQPLATIRVFKPRPKRPEMNNQKMKIQAVLHCDIVMDSTKDRAYIQGPIKISISVTYSLMDDINSGGNVWVAI